MTKLTERTRIVPAQFDDGWVLEIDGDVQSHVDLNDPSLMRFEYLRRIGNVLDICWLSTQPIRILHLGAGALTLARYVQATRPGSEQTVIELDPALVKLVTSELPLPVGTALRVITGDARTKLQELEQQHFDAIIVDIFTDTDTAAHLSEAEFYQEILARLSKQGVLLVNIGDEDGLQFVRQQTRVLHQVVIRAGLSGVWTLADAAMLDRKLAGNAVLAAGPGLPTEHAEVATLRSRLAAAGPFPASVLAPDETAVLLKMSADDE